MIEPTIQAQTSLLIQKHDDKSTQHKNQQNKKQKPYLFSVSFMLLLLCSFASCEYGLNIVFSFFFLLSLWPAALSFFVIVGFLRDYSCKKWKKWVVCRQFFSCHLRKWRLKPEPLKMYCHVVSWRVGFRNPKRRLKSEPLKSYCCCWKCLGTYRTRVRRSVCVRSRPQKKIRGIKESNKNTAKYERTWIKKWFKNLLQAPLGLPH